MNWTSEDGILVPLELPTPAAEYLVTGLFLNELYLVNSVPNEYHRYLDPIFCDDLTNLQVRPAQIPLIRVVQHVQHHIPVEHDFSLSFIPVFQNNENEVYNFDRVNYCSLDNYLSTIDWSFLERTVDVNDAVHKFYKIMLLAIKKYIPK